MNFDIHQKKEQLHSTFHQLRHSLLRLIDIIVFLRFYSTCHQHLFCQMKHQLEKWLVLFRMDSSELIGLFIFRRFLPLFSSWSTRSRFVFYFHITKQLSSRFFKRIPIYSILGQFHTFQIASQKLFSNTWNAHFNDRLINDHIHDFSKPFCFFRTS